jgi:hypothetical protein
MRTALIVMGTALLSVTTVAQQTAQSKWVKSLECAQIKGKWVKGADVLAYAASADGEGSCESEIVVNPILARRNGNFELANLHKYRYSEIDMPVSLGVGTVRTPEFAVKKEAYFIMVQAEKRLPYLDMVCMMGITLSPLQLEQCKKANKESLLQASWRVLDGEQVVAEGTSSDHPGEYTDKYMFKFLGQFMGESQKKYVVDVRFTKDGTPLNATNPHLIVIAVKNH